MSGFWYKLPLLPAASFVKRIGLLEAHHPHYAAVDDFFGEWAMRWISRVNRSSASAHLIKYKKKKLELASNRLCESPKLCIVITSFNQAWNVAQLAHRLTRSAFVDELIICEDGSVDTSLGLWVQATRFSQNVFILRTNDLHEMRTTDRAFRLSNAQILCIVQDDDAIPTSDEWLAGALQRFEDDQRLGVIVGFVGFKECPSEKFPLEQCHGYMRAENKVHGETEKFAYIASGGIGPYFVRKQCYESVGGWDWNFSNVGEPGIGFEHDFAFRCWESNWRVGYMFTPLKGPALIYEMDGGTTMYGNDARTRRNFLNHKRVAQSFVKKASEINTKVQMAQQNL